MERLRILLISVFVLVIAGCSSLGPRPIGRVTYQVSGSELPHEFKFKAHSRQPFSLLLAPEPDDTAALRSHLFSISLMDRHGGLVAGLSFTEDNCNSFYSFSMRKAVKGEIQVQYFDDSLPGVEDLQVSVFEGEAANGATHTFVGVNEIQLPLPRGSHIQQVSVWLNQPVTMSTANLVDSERK